MKTKIIATVGPACDSPEKMKELINSGVSIFRLNFSHGDSRQFKDIVDNIRALETELQIPVTVLQDLAGPKIRIGDLAAPLTFQAGDTAILGADCGDRHMERPFIPFTDEKILENMEEGDRLVLADGTLQLLVLEKLPDGLFVLQAQNSGIVTSRKGLALPGKSVRVPALTDKDKQDLRAGLSLGVDAVALSYVQTPEDILEAREIILSRGKNVPIVAKLERQNAVDRLEDILRVADVIMVARGDLGIECPLPALPGMQKRIIRACNRACKPVIVATQMLLSMVNSPAPTRAETTDVANAVLDGADCVMLSEETAMGSFPVETVRFMRWITGEAEKLLEEHGLRHNLPELDNASEFLSYSACLLADKTDSVGIAAHSMSGASGRSLSARKPRQPVYAITPKQSVLRHLNFSWGVVPVLVSDALKGHLERTEKFIDDFDGFKKGDNIVITAGQPHPGEEALGTNLVKIYRK
ncbi:MAG: pyruvate kinase [Deltaproteobacteria bacterium]|nr:pyruvate kinase [Deltaproteobacteria bacterium]